MGLFNRTKNQDDGSAIRTTALVIDADPPPQNAPHFGTGSHGFIRILVNVGSGPVQVQGTFRFHDDRWLVRGMEVGVIINPAHPERFEVDWEPIPSMEARVAANDPTLADPLGAGRRVAHAMGLTQADTGTRRADSFRASMEKAAATPAPAGKVRAVVIVVSVRGRAQSGEQGDTDYDSGLSFERKSNAVFAVNVPGRPPYATFVPKFKYPKSRADISGGGLPALVSVSDPGEVEVLWDELPSTESQIADRIAAGPQGVGRANEMRDQMLAAMNQAATSQPGAVNQAVPGGPVPAAGAAGIAAMAPQMRQLAIDNLKRSLQYIPDPAMRQMMINQYRAAGIDIDAE